MYKWEKFHGNAFGAAVKGYYSSLWLEGYKVMSLGCISLW